jgi:FdhE protein
VNWDAALARADVLAARHRGAGEILQFARAVLRFQKEIYRKSKAANRVDARRLDTALLASFFPDFLQLVEKYGPPELAAQAQKLQDRQDWEELLRACWKQERDRLEVLARAILQPYVQYLSERWHVEVGLLGEAGGSCPFCSRPPLLSVANGKRMLVCSLCCYEWAFPDKECPGCRAKAIEQHRHRSFPHLRVDACSSCRRYLKSVDLSKDPVAVPIVDEMASPELDRLARDRGFTKLQRNLAGQ